MGYVYPEGEPHLNQVFFIQRPGFPGRRKLMLQKDIINELIESLRKEKVTTNPERGSHIDKK